MRSVSKARNPRAGVGGRSSLWRFSLGFYTRSGVAPALIALQDRAGFDVNLILFALWLGVSGRGRIDGEGLAAAERAVCPIRTEITEPLRALRRRLKPWPDADIQRLREAAGRIELAGEKAAQDRLASLAPSRPRDTEPADRLAAALANLAFCLGPVEAAGVEVAVLRQGIEAYLLHGGSSGSPQRRTVPASRSNRSRTRPKV